MAMAQAKVRVEAKKVILIKVSVKDLIFQILVILDLVPAALAKAANEAVVLVTAADSEVVEMAAPAVASKVVHKEASKAVDLVLVVPAADTNLKF